MNVLLVIHLGIIQKAEHKNGVKAEFFQGKNELFQVLSSGSTQG